jgi:hypothetical protein
LLFVSQISGPGSYSCSNPVPPVTSNLITCTSQVPFLVTTVPLDVVFTVIYQATMPNCGCECPDAYAGFGPVGNSSLILFALYNLSTMGGTPCTMLCSAAWNSNGTSFNNPCRGTE